MATPVLSRPANKRYLGNTNTTEVHDLNNEQPSCRIATIIGAFHGVVFTPDTLTQAHSEKYDNCAHCIGASRR